MSIDDDHPEPDMRSTLTSTYRRAALPIAALLASVSAHASFTVIDDDLYPSYMTEARSRAIDGLNSDKLKITFSKGSAVLNPMARSFLDEMTPRLRNAAQIRIIGSMDSASENENKKNRKIGTARAAAIRSYLLNQGIAADILEVEVQTGSNPDASKGFSTTDVVVSNARSARSATQERAIPGNYQYLRNGTVPAVPASFVAQPVSPSINNEAMLQYINLAVQSGQMAPSVAVEMIRSMLEAKTSTPVITGTSTHSAVYAPQNYQPPPAQGWTLDASKNLKENFDTWASASGWKPTVWNASNLYQVTSTTILQGTFPNILKRISDSTGLNICVISREKYVLVTDPDVPCNKKEL